MKPHWKATLYVTLAAIIPVGEIAAVAAKNSVWPNKFELVALFVASLTQALLALKMYYSDPTAKAPA